MPRRRSRVENLDPQARTKIRSARPQIEVVEERVLLATFTVTSTFDNGDNLNPTPGSLRQAILTANSPNFPGLDLINFSISNTIGGGVRTIAPPAPLPPITDPVVIDGYTQPGSARNTLAVGSNAVLQVELNGAGAGPGAGLTIVGGGSTVQGLAINRFNGPGILLSSGGGNRIVGNVIGTNAAGTAALANLGDGVAIVNSPGNVIGGTAPADRNVISGNGGVFQAPVNYSAGSGPVAVAAGDFNRDSRIDLVRVNPSISAIGILLGDPNGSGTFVPGATITGVARPNDVVVGDFTGDGISDLLVADNSTTTSVFLFRGNGDGTFQQPGVAIPNSGAVSTFIAVGDLNNDVIADLVVVNSPFAPSQIPGDVRVLFGNGNGTFRAPVILATGPSFAGVAVGTFGFDPTTFDAINGVVVSDSAANTVRVFLSNNDGTFQPALPLAVGTSPAGVAVDDLTNDGRGDIVVANAGSNTISLLIQNAAGGTFQPARNLAAGTTPTRVALGDFDGDFQTDIVASNAGSNDLTVITRGGPGSLRPAVRIGVGTSPGGLAVLGSGQGVAVANTGGNTVSVLLPATTIAGGVHITGSGATGNLVQGNYIGVNAAGAAALPNAGDGVLIEEAPINTIGGTAAGAGNVITGNNRHGVRIDNPSTAAGQPPFGGGATGNLVQGNLIGLNAAGGAAPGNALSGVMIHLAPGNTIGGAAAGARNVISGNLQDGIRVAGEFNSDFTGILDAPGNLIQGNYIGTDVTGTVDLGNFGQGILVNLATRATIGGAAPGAGNLISGNTNHGIDIRGSSFLGMGGSDNLIQGNSIGTNAAGTAALRNDQEGIVLNDSPRNTIGGTTPGARNLISGNGDDGIALRSDPPSSDPDFPVLQRSSNNLIQGNFIGTDITGTVALPNGSRSGIVGAGIFLADSPGNTIGGAAPGAGNLISGNMIRGLLISRPASTGNLVQGNLIGTDATGTRPLGNTQEGVRFHNETSGNLVVGNVIAFNGTDGVAVAAGDPGFAATAARNAILTNSIFANGGLGIDLEPDGVTPNDPGDADVGLNLLQNAPVLASATITDGSVVIVGTLNSTPFATFTVQFFANAAVDPSGFGEGQQFLGQTTVTTDGAGNAAIVAMLPASTLVGGFLTATATDPAGNTSEFSAAIPFLVVQVPSFTVINTNDSGPGSLRQAILNANFFPGRQTIDFAIPGPGPFSIVLASPLPFVTEAAVIDALTQRVFAGLPSGNSTPIVELVGANVGPDASGLVIIAGGTTVQGLVINRFVRAGIELAFGGGNILQNNYIGTDLSGTVALGNGDGILIATANNTIGGTIAAGRNIIAGNRGDGIRIQGSGATGNLIAGNLIGLGGLNNALGNGGSGVGILDAPRNTVGGTTAALRNVISSNGVDGVHIEGSGASGNVVAGNYIGTGMGAEIADRGNAFAGVDIVDAPGNTVGGSAPGARNLISGNEAVGVRLFGGGATGNLVAGNFIGTDVDGTARIGNGTGVGILDAPRNTVGGTAAALRNVISGNDAVGVFLSGSGATGNAVQGNYIGTDVGGNNDLGNTGDGIGIDDAPGNLIGGPGGRNVISGNGDAQNEAAGINIDGELATGNVVQGNYIGTDAAGTGRLGNSFHGVFVFAAGNLIGGDGEAARNVISANGQRQIGGEDGVGVYLFGDGGNVVQGNYIGTDVTGTRDLGNTKMGVLANDSPGNTIGGNVISGNGLIGLELANTGATGNVVQRNFIGVDVSGRRRLSNGIPGTDETQRDGIGIFINNAPGNLIGGVGAGNVVSGNLSVGIQFLGVGATGNVIQGNRIGTDMSGTEAIPNALDGVFLQDAPGNTIGGVQRTEGNVIAGNGGNGLHLNGSGSTGNVVQGNFIGVDISGVTPLANGGFGVLLNSGAAGNTFDGPPAERDNVIGTNGTGPVRDVNLDQPARGQGSAGVRARSKRQAARRLVRMLTIKSRLVWRRSRPASARGSR